MDFLKVLLSLISQAEIERKRKQDQEIFGNAKVFKRRDLQEHQRQVYLASKKESVQALPKETCSIKTATAQTTADLLSKIPPDEIMKRLRARGQPIRLFGESDLARLERLGQVESKEERTDGQKNDFKALLEATEEEIQLQKLYGISKAADGQRKPDKKIKDIDRPELDPLQINQDLLDNDPERLYTLISVYFKRLHREWERTLANRPDTEKQSQEVFLFYSRSRENDKQPFAHNRQNISNLFTNNSRNKQSKRIFFLASQIYVDTYNEENTKWPMMYICACPLETRRGPLV